MRRVPTLRLIAGLVAVLTATAACSASGEADRSTPWGSEANRYFQALSDAYLDNDFYGVLDFYAVSAHVEKWRGAVRGGLPVSDLLRWNSGDLGQELETVYLGGDGALSLVLWPRVGDQGAVVSTMDGGRISREIVFELAASLDRSLRASPDVITMYEGLYDAYAEAWSVADSGYRNRIYSASAKVSDALLGVEASGRHEIVALPSRATWTPILSTAHSGDDGSAEGPSIYLGPRDYAQDPQRAVGIYEVTDSAGCAQLVGVHWTLDDGLIVDEHRYREPESFRRCTDGLLPDGWWTGLDLPPPSDRVVTGTLVTPEGRRLVIHNGTQRLETFLRYGLGRFAVADLEEPILDTVTFEPSRSCDQRSGRVLDDGSARELFLCIYESDLCPASTECATPTLSARLALLHELGHVWILEHVGSDTQQQLLDLTGRESWDSLDVPWTDRGAEYAAEVFAWGLLEETVPLVRFGAPPCEELVEAFSMLTGASPLRDPADCPGK